MPRVTTLPRLADELGVTPRRLKDYLKGRGVGKRLGRSIIFTDVDVRIILHSLPDWGTPAFDPTASWPRRDRGLRDNCSLEDVMKILRELTKPKPGYDKRGKKPRSV